MIYSSKVKTAIWFAFNFHDGQKDKGNYPYICHPLHVAEQMDDEESTIVAILHDVVEDTTCTLELFSYFFSQSILDAIDAITRREDEEYFDYIHRVAENEIAKKVKIADLHHNLDESRLYKQKLPEKLKSRYEKALSILGAPNN